MAKTATVENCEALAEGEGRRVEIDDKDIALFRVGNRFLAIDNECPHYGASLADGWVQDGVVSCPWHCWQFDLTTGHCLTLPGYNVTSYKVRIEDGVAHIEIEDETPEAAAPEAAESQSAS